MPLGINVFGVNGLVTVIDVCAMVLDGNAVICVLPKASTKLTREKKQEEKKHISKLALPWNFFFFLVLFWFPEIVKKFEIFVCSVGWCDLKEKNK